MMRICEKMDMHNVCRLCMCMSSTTYHLFESQESFNWQLPCKVKKCIPLIIEKNDELPKGICKNCIAIIDLFYEYLSQCSNTESMLNNFCRTSSVSHQFKCEGKLIIGESLSGSYNDNFVSTKKNDSSDHSSSKLTIQSLFSLVQSGSLQIVNDTSGRYEDVCKYNEKPVTEANNEVKFNNCNDTVANNLMQQIQTDLSKDNNPNDVQKIYSSPDIFNLHKEDTEININPVNNMIVEPEIINFQFIQSDNDKVSDLDDSISEVFDDSKHINRILSIDGISTSCSACGKNLESEEEIGTHFKTCMQLKNKTVRNLTSSTATYVKPLRFSCNICEKQFKRKNHLIRHFKVHTLRVTFKCKTCKRLYKCGMNRENFSAKLNLRKHQTKHRVSKPFVCQTCGKSFRVKYNYNMHMKIHNNVKDNEDI